MQFPFTEWFPHICNPINQSINQTCVKNNECLHDQTLSINANPRFLFPFPSTQRDIYIHLKHKKKKTKLLEDKAGYVKTPIYPKCEECDEARSQDL
jgi:hypothetical protein